MSQIKIINDYLLSSNRIDRLHEIKIIPLEVYGYDKDNKPNNHCKWDSKTNKWVELEEHIKERVSKIEYEEHLFKKRINKEEKAIEETRHKKRNNRKKSKK